MTESMDSQWVKPIATLVSRKFVNDNKELAIALSVTIILVIG